MNNKYMKKRYIIRNIQKKDIQNIYRRKTYIGEIYKKYMEEKDKQNQERKNIKRNEI